MQYLQTSKRLFEYRYAERTLTKAYHFLFPESIPLPAKSSFYQIYSVLFILFYLFFFIYSVSFISNQSTLLYGSLGLLSVLHPQIMHDTALFAFVWAQESKYFLIGMTVYKVIHYSSHAKSSNNVKNRMLL